MPANDLVSDKRELETVGRLTGYGEQTPKPLQGRHDYVNLLLDDVRVGRVERPMHG